MLSEVRQNGNVPYAWLRKSIKKYSRLYLWEWVPDVDPAWTLIYTPHGLKLGSRAHLECWKFRRFRRWKDKFWLCGKLSCSFWLCFMFWVPMICFRIWPSVGAGSMMRLYWVLYGDIFIYWKKNESVFKNTIKAARIIPNTTILIGVPTAKIATVRTLRRGIFQLDGIPTKYLKSKEVRLRMTSKEPIGSLPENIIRTRSNIWAMNSRYSLEKRFKEVQQAYQELKLKWLNFIYI